MTPATTDLDLRTKTTDELVDPLKTLPRHEWNAAYREATADGAWRADLRGANLWGANLGGVDLRRANIRGANLVGAYLRGADLRRANLWGANLWGASLRRAKLGGADLRGVNLWGANLGGADLRGVNLWGANLGGADLRDVNLWGANLGGVDLWCADLRRANIRGVDLWGANLVGANLVGASLDEHTLTGRLACIGEAAGHPVLLLATDTGHVLRAGCWTGVLDDAVERALEERDDAVTRVEADAVVAHGRALLAAWSEADA